MLADLVENERILCLFSVKELVVSHPHEHVLVFVGCFHVLVVKSPTDTDFENELCVWIVISELDFGVQAGRIDIHFDEPVADLLSKGCNLSQDVDIKAAILTPFLL